MAFDFQTYLKAKDNYCFSYNGNYKEFIWQLLQIRKYAKKRFPNINIFISCIPEIAKQISEEGIISADDLRNHLFLKVEEINFDMVNNPVLKILKESEIIVDKVKINSGKKCHIICDGKIPFKSCNLDKIKKYLSKDYDVVKLEEANVLFAIECEELYKWAYYNKKTVLLKTNNDEIYKNLYPGREILDTNNI